MPAKQSFSGTANLVNNTVTILNFAAETPKFYSYIGRLTLTGLDAASQIQIVENTLINPAIQPTNNTISVSLEFESDVERIVQLKDYMNLSGSVAWTLDLYKQDYLVETDPRLDNLLPVDTGPFTVTVTVKDTNSVLLQDAFVRASMNGQTKSGTKRTNVNGVTTCGVMSGIYTFSAYAQGFVSTLQTLNITADVDLELILTPLQLDLGTIPSVGMTTAYLTCYNEFNVVQAAVKHTFRLKQPASEFDSYSNHPISKYSDAGGLIIIELMQNSTYEAYRENGEVIEFTTGAEAEYHIPLIIGWP